MHEAGIRAFVGKLSMDQSSRPTYMESAADASLAAAASFVDNCNAIEEHLLPHEKLIEPVLTPRFVPTCSDDLLSGLGQLSKERNLRVQSHMAEAHDQVEWVRQQRGMEDMDVFDKVGRCRLPITETDRSLNSTAFSHFEQSKHIAPSLILPPFIT